MRRRGKMFSRVVFWTLGAILGFAINRLLGENPDVARFVMFWLGMMLAATFIHFDPPEIDLWEKSA